MLDVMKPVILLMLTTQAVNVPPWKIVIWFERVLDILQKIETNLKDVQAGFQPSKELLPKLSKHWEELTYSEEGGDDDEDSTSDADIGTFQVK